MEERVALFREYETGFFSATELCRRHGISRETFYPAFAGWRVISWPENRDSAILFSGFHAHWSRCHGAPGG